MSKHFRTLNLILKKKSNAQTFSFSALYKFQNVLLVHFLFQVWTSSKMCSLYTFLFSFVHAPECAYCTSILYICNIIQFYLYFMLAKDGSYSIIVYMFVTVIVFLFLKNMTRASAWVKTQKLCHNCPTIYLFSWERERKPLYLKPYFKTLKYCKCIFWLTCTTH